MKRLTGALGGGPIWVNPSLVAAIEANGAGAIIVMIGCANPVKVTIKESPDEAAAILNAKEVK